MNGKAIKPFRRSFIKLTKNKGAMLSAFPGMTTLKDDTNVTSALRELGGGGVSCVLDAQSLFFYKRKLDLRHDQTSF